MKKLIFLTFLFCLFSCSREYSISGYVYDPEDNPVQGAYCKFGDGDSSKTHTDENGYYSLSWAEDIAGGCPFLLVRMPGFKDHIYDWNCDIDRDAENHTVKLIYE